MISMTMNELRLAHHDALTALIAKAGNQSHLARMLGVSPSLVGGWVQRGRISLTGAQLVADHPVLGEEFPISKTRPEL